MKRFFGIACLLLLGLTGCATHYYSIKGEVLHLYLHKPEARKVYFACSLDAFELRSARKIDPETWAVELPADREFRYFYIADGEVFSPSCRFKEMDDFGSQNCIFIPGM